MITLYHTLPKEPTVEQVQALRVAVERTADPYLYWFCANAFMIVDMPSAAGAMIRKADHYMGVRK